MLQIEFLSCAFEVTILQGVLMCDPCSDFSILLFIPEILWGEGRPVGDFRVFPCFAALNDGRRKDENVSKCSRDHHPKLEQADCTAAKARIFGGGAGVAGSVGKKTGPLTGATHA